VLCPHGHDGGLIPRMATPAEVDAGCELGVAYDQCPACEQEHLDGAMQAIGRLARFVDLYHFTCRDCVPDNQLVVTYPTRDERDRSAIAHIDAFPYHRLRLWHSPRPEPAYATAVQRGDEGEQQP
jgi:hypothetical protein